MLFVPPLEQFKNIPDDIKKGQDAKITSEITLTRQILWVYSPPP